MIISKQRELKTFVFLLPSCFLSIEFCFWARTVAIVGPAFPVPAQSGIDVTVVKKAMNLCHEPCWLLRT